MSLGVRYIEGALVPDSKDVLPAPEVPTGRRRDYVPCAVPGSRLPHMNVRVLSNLPSEVNNPIMNLLAHTFLGFRLGCCGYVKLELPIVIFASLLVII